ncbi:MAG: AI-2E family transporter [Desulfuromonas sp.]|nr:AI-2E family transporter [Desulfuromonas thiophila]
MPSPLPRSRRFYLSLDRRLISLLTLLALLLLIGNRLQAVLTLFGIAFLIAYVLDPLADLLERRGLGRNLAVVMIFATFSLLGSLLLWLVLPRVLVELAQLAQATPAYADWAQQQLTRLAALAGVQLDRQFLLGLLAERIGALSSLGQQLLTQLSRQLGALSNLMLELALIPVLVFYFLRDFDRIVERVLINVKQRSRYDLRPYYLHFNRIVARYFRGQLLVAAFLACGYSLVLSLCDVSPALTLGLVAGLLGIVPYLGLVIGLGTALILALMQHGDLLHPLLVLGGFVLVQSIEGNIVTPRLVGASIGLHPAGVIFALMAGGALFGIGGMIVALPVAAFVVVLLEDVWGLNLRGDPGQAETLVSDSHPPEPAAEPPAEPS